MSRSLVQFVRTDDGARIAYRLRESLHGQQRVVLLHSLGMDHQLWNSVVESLGSNVTVLCLDLRGHGESDRPPPPYGVSRLAADLRNVTDHLEWEEFVLVGASLGGCVALEFAAANPGRLKALGLVNSTAWYGPNGALLWNSRARRAREEGLAAMVPFQETRWFTDAFRVVRPHVVERCIQTFLGNDAPVYAGLSEMLGRFDGRSLLPLINVPTSIIVGEEDYATPVSMSQALQRGIRDSKLTVVPSVRHFTQLERPDAVTTMVTRLLAVAEKA